MHAFSIKSQAQHYIQQYQQETQHNIGTKNGGEASQVWGVSND